MFYKGEVYQGAKKTIYPYPFLDKLTDIRENKTYNALYLENEYVKVSFLPQLGGRLFSALDKTNNYDFFYRQHVIKPVLIGMLGAWISGGIEWCVLHHHRATTFMPVDYTLAENPDGSKTIWLAELERRHRMRWIIGATLYPDRSYLEVKVRIFNRTPFPNTFLYWANVAVHSNPDYRVIFPPSTEFATYHAKNDFAHWPVSNETYRGVDYTGVDLTWWKNHPKPISFFAWDLREDFSGGYDHGKKAGVIHVGNHHIVTGAKLWEWGPGPRGRMWDKILTETDGPYIELMVGAYSDNQPDYSWIRPYEVKTFTQYWYPIREIGNVKNANLRAAVNLELTDENVARIGFNTTSQYLNARVLLTAGDRVLFEQKTNIGPDKPFLKGIALSAGIEETDLQASLFSSANEELISYKPVEKPYNPELPEVVKAPPAPEDIETIEELYLAGLRIEQFHNPTLDPYPYYEEVLRRDPGDSRVNTILGIDYNRRGMFKEAEGKLRVAVERISKNYTKPRNNEAYYNLGLTLKAQRKYDDAYDNFYKATWDYAFHSASYYQLAEISCLKGDFTQALEQINRSLSTDTLNTKALNSKTVILRNLGQLRQAEKTASRVIGIDPLDFWAMNELYLAESTEGSKSRADNILNDLKTKMRNEVQSYLELAVDYGNLGQWDDAVEILLRAVDINKKPLSTYPLVYYYLGYFYQKKGDSDNASKYYSLAVKMPSDYCFPFRLESIDVLSNVVRHNSSDARAYYYLGNLLYDIQPENAIKAWGKSVALDDTFATVHRNLGWAYYRTEKNTPKAIAGYEKAIACDSKDPRLYAELDVLYEVEGISPQTRLALLEKNHKTVIERDDSFLREIMLLVQVGRYSDAIKFLTNNHFHVWEGGGEVHDVYVDAYLLRGGEKFKNRQYQESLKDYQAASEYPENLEVGRPRNDRRAPQVNYLIATAYEALGDEREAKKLYQKAVQQQSMSQWPQTRYYQALALGKLGQNEKARQIFDELIATGQQKLTEDLAMDFFAKFGEQETKEARLASAHYTIGLGYLGNGQIPKAKAQFEQAVNLNINHLWAAAQLSKLK
jgi:tetratricopeptide (TPR) repeat protein